jgi:hypothetical protein
MDKLKILVGIIRGKPISRKLLVQIVTSALVFAGSYALQKFGLSSNPAYRSDVSFAAAQIGGLVVAWATKEWPSLLGTPAVKPAKPVAMAHTRMPINDDAPAPEMVTIGHATHALQAKPDDESDPITIGHVKIPVQVPAPVAKPAVAPPIPAPVVRVPTAEALKLPESAPASKPVPQAWTEPVEQPDGQPAEMGPRTITG